VSVQSAGSRLTLYEHTLALIRDFRFTGGGLAAFPGLYSHYILGISSDFFFYSHNMFLGILLEQGPLGLLALVGLLIGSGWLLVQPRTAVATMPNFSLLRWTMLASLLIMVIHGLVDDPLYGHRGTPLLFLVPGLAVALNQAVWRLFQWRWPTQRQAIATGVGLLTMVVLVLVAWVGPLRADWYANLGAVTMARIELANWPSNQWDTGSNVAALEPAERLFNQALAANPGQPTAHHRLGLIAMLRRDYVTAIEQLEVANRADPGHTGIRKALGYSYAWVGRLDEAKVLLVNVPEAAQELEIYVWWWVEQDRVDLAERATQMLARLQSAPTTGN
jgi:tetratricopeptide (TPR) repeat protein